MQKIIVKIFIYHLTVCVSLSAFAADEMIDATYHRLET